MFSNWELFLNKPFKITTLKSTQIIYAPNTTSNRLLNTRKLWFSDISGFIRNHKVYTYLLVRTPETLKPLMFITLSHPSTIYWDNWALREFNEFFGYIFSTGSDSRNILLDYTYTTQPLVKDYPYCGYEEILYNTSSNSVEYFNVGNIEL